MRLQKRSVASRQAKLAVAFVMLVSVFGPLLSSLPANAAAPIEINDCVELQKIGNDVAYPLDGDYVVGNDFSCGVTNPSNPDNAASQWNDGKGFVPIGPNDSTPFTGTFDGNNHVIDNLTIIRADDISGIDGESINGGADYQYVGLFGYASQATIQNLSLEYARVKGFYDVGGIVGYAANSTLANLGVNDGFSSQPHTDGCTTNYCIWARYGERGGGIAGTLYGGTLTNAHTGSNVKGSGIIIGGLVGQALEGAVISDSSSSAGVDGGDRIGGLVGEAADIEIHNSSASGRIDTVYEYQVDKFGSYGGGLVGSANNIEVTDSQASGDVYGAWNIGGFAGLLFGSDVSGSAASGDVYAAGSFVGGFTGSSGCSSIISTSSASGNVQGSDYVGGFTGTDGCMGPGSTITESFSTGSITASGSYAGGFAGSAFESTIERSYSTSAVVGSGDFVGGLIGYFSSQSSMTDSYSRGNATGTNFVGGLIGQNAGDSYITNVYATGAVNGSGTVGGLVGGGEDGSNLYTVASFWDTQTTGTSVSTAGEGKATTVMKNPATFTSELGSDSWDYETVWDQASDMNDGYPCLRWDQDCLSTGDSGALVLESAEDGSAITIEQTTCSSFDNSSVTKESSLVVQDAGYNYPAGFAGFTLSGCGAGATTTVTINFVGDFNIDDVSLRKYNPEDKSFATIVGASKTANTINDMPSVEFTYSITDGGELDQDGIANGTIVDPVGLAVVQVSAASSDLASTGHNVSLILSIAVGLMLAGASMLSLRRLHQNI